MKNYLNYSLIFLLLISLNSCFSYKEVEVQEVQSVKVLNMNDNTADIEVTLKISNPNPWKIVVKDYDLQAFVNKKYVGKVNYDTKILLPKKSERSYKLVLTADMHQVKKLMPSIVFSNKALLNIKGDLKVKAKGISKKLTIDREEKISKKDLGGIFTASNQKNH